MVERVTEKITEILPGIELSLKLSSSGRVTGRAVWSGFDDLDQVDRQLKLRNVLKTELGADASQVSVILAYTPYEIRAMQEAQNSKPSTNYPR